METSLHRQLKEKYLSPGAAIEVPVDGYRIDVAAEDRLIEIQHGSLAAIRDKIRKLLENHHVLVVKPIILRKQLVKLDGPEGNELSRRMSPKKGQVLDIFNELVYFTRVFPHPNLTLEVTMVRTEERRYPGHGRRRRRRDGDFVVEDQILTKVEETHIFRKAEDLLALLPPKLPKKFHTGHLADGLSIRRWIAQRVAYSLREMGAIEMVGKEGNAILYKFAKGKKPSRRKKRKKVA